METMLGRMDKVRLEKAVEELSQAVEDYAISESGCSIEADCRYRCDVYMAELRARDARRAAEKPAPVDLSDAWYEAPDGSLHQAQLFDSVWYAPWRHAGSRVVHTFGRAFPDDHTEIFLPRITYDAAWREKVAMTCGFQHDPHEEPPIDGDELVSHGYISYQARHVRVRLSDGMVWRTGRGSGTKALTPAEWLAACREVAGAKVDAPVTVLESGPPPRAVWVSEAEKPTPIGPNSRYQSPHVPGVHKAALIDGEWREPVAVQWEPAVNPWRVGYYIAATRKVYDGDGRESMFSDAELYGGIRPMTRLPDAAPVAPEPLTLEWMRERCVAVGLKATGAPKIGYSRSGSTCEWPWVFLGNFDGDPYAEFWHAVADAIVVTTRADFERELAKMVAPPVVAPEPSEPGADVLRHYIGGREYVLFDAHQAQLASVTAERDALKTELAKRAPVASGVGGGTVTDVSAWTVPVAKPKPLADVTAADTVVGVTLGGKAVVVPKPKRKVAKKPAPKKRK